MPQYIPAENVNQICPRKDYLVYPDGALRRIEKVSPASYGVDVVASCDDEMEGSSNSTIELRFVVNGGIIRIGPAIGISRYD